MEQGMGGGVVDEDVWIFAPYDILGIIWGECDPTLYHSCEVMSRDKGGEVWVVGKDVFGWSIRLVHPEIGSTNNDLSVLEGSVGCKEASSVIDITIGDEIIGAGSQDNVSWVISSVVGGCS